MRQSSLFGAIPVDSFLTAIDAPPPNAVNTNTGSRLWIITESSLISTM